jgi:hypothetical protein
MKTNHYEAGAPELTATGSIELSTFIPLLRFAEGGT